MRIRRLVRSTAVMGLLVWMVVLGAPSAGASPTGVTVAGGNGSGSGADQLYFPLGVTLDAAGNLYVADDGNARVQRWAPGATSGVTVAGGNDFGPAADQIDPTGVAVDAAGNVYVADASNSRVQRWAPGATSGVTVAGGNGPGPAADQLAGPYSVAVDATGDVYVADTGNARVQRWAPGATSGVTVAGGNGSGPAADQLAGPQGVALDESGNVYVADTFNARVQRWAPGATSGVTVAGGNGFGSGADQLGNAYGVAVDVGGSVYVADSGSGNARVQLWAPGASSGVTVAGTGGPGSGADELDEPHGVAVSGDGDLYVADTFNDRVQLWVPDRPRALPGVGSVPEGNSGTTPVEVPLTLSRPWFEPVTVAWRTVTASGTHPGQADPATDYTPASGTVTFAPGETSRTVAVDVHGDTVAEPDEWFAVSFHDASNATVGGVWGLGYGVITDDEQLTVVPGSARVSQPPADILPPTPLHLPVTLSAPSTQTVTVQWNTLYIPGGPPDQALPTGVGGHPDYTPASGTVTFAPGQTEATVTIDVLVGGFIEPEEFFVVSFHDATNAKIGGYWGLGFGIINAGD